MISHLRLLYTRDIHNRDIPPILASSKLALWLTVTGPHYRSDLRPAWLLPPANVLPRSISRSNSFSANFALSTCMHENLRSDTQRSPPLIEPCVHHATPYLSGFIDVLGHDLPGLALCASSRLDGCCPPDPPHLHPHRARRHVSATQHEAQYMMRFQQSILLHK